MPDQKQADMMPCHPNAVNIDSETMENLTDSKQYNPILTSAENHSKLFKNIL